MPRRITVKLYNNIKIEVWVNEDSCSGSIESNLKDHLSSTQADVIESVVLAQACEGIDITSQQYRLAMINAVDAIANH